MNSTDLPMAIRVIHLPGMSGQGPLDNWFATGLRKAGLDDVQVINWPKSRLMMLFNLRNRNQHMTAARNLAGDLQQYHQRHPNHQQIITAHSTGAMVTLDTLSLLDAPIVSQAWLLAAAVHCEIDLTRALGGVKRIVNVYSPRDMLLLGAGTAIFGNADGVRGDSAGRVPFRGPGAEDDHVEQLPYNPLWSKSGNLGWHTSVLVGTFAEKVLGPMILARAGDRP